MTKRVRHNRFFKPLLIGALAACLLAFLWPSTRTQVLPSLHLETFTLGLPDSPWYTHYLLRLRAGNRYAADDLDQLVFSIADTLEEDLEDSPPHRALMQYLSDGSQELVRGEPWEYQSCDFLSSSMLPGLILAGSIITGLTISLADWLARRHARMSPLYRADTGSVTLLSATPLPPPRREPPRLLNGPD